MKVALVHDYLNEFGGAERVLLALSEIWPQAPIYTSYYKKGSPAWQKFKDKNIRVSWAHWVPFWDKLASPLRFLAPLVWGSLAHQLTDYDIVISSSSWYVTKGFANGKKPIEICYCHTPPRYLYGYQTSIDWQKYWPVRLYAAIVNHLMRLYDFKAAQKVDYFIANSENVQQRIKKFYGREAVVIYPPVKLDIRSQSLELSKKNKKAKLQALRTNNYFLVVSRLVGGKGLELAVRAANKLGLRLKIVGEPGGYGREYQKIKKISGKNIEFLGFVKDSELAQLYRGAKALLALSQDEDFGITPVEAMAAGTPVIAYRGGGYVESIIDGKTGVFFDKLSVDNLVKTIKQFNNLKIYPNDCIKQAQKFSKEHFIKQIKQFVKKAYEKSY